MSTLKTKACGNSKCKVSTGIDGSLTFGSGRLSDYGYWKKPCFLCEEKYYEKQRMRFAYRVSLRSQWSTYIAK